MAKADTAILDQAGIARAVTRIAHEILEHNKGCGNLALIGIRTGGDHLASLLRARINDIEGIEVPIGEVDITMYRDDLAARGNLPIGKTSIPFPLDGIDVVLVDDVLYTGRTIRSAMDALMDFGRPSTIQLAVLMLTRRGFVRSGAELQGAAALSKSTSAPSFSRRSTR